MFLVFGVCSSPWLFFLQGGFFKGILLLKCHPSDIHCFAFSLSSYDFSSHESLLFPICFLFLVLSFLLTLCFLFAPVGVHAQDSKESSEIVASCEIW